MNSIVAFHGDLYAAQSGSFGCNGCAFYKDKCISPGLDCAGVIYKLRSKSIMIIHGKKYQKEKCTIGCRGCAFEAELEFLKGVEE